MMTIHADNLALALVHTMPPNGQPSLAALRLLVPCLLHDVDGVAERGEEATDTKNDVQNENEEEDAEDVKRVGQKVLHALPP